MSNQISYQLIDDSVKQKKENGFKSCLLWK